MAPKDMTYYNLLNVPPTATPAQIRKAFRLLALRHHPDRNQNTPASTAHFQHLRAVHDLLLDPARRADYDLSGHIDAALHGSDPAATDAATAAFFARPSAPVSADDIAAYEATYRGGPEERQDLHEHFTRFAGAVAAVLDYVPCSEEIDLPRFIRFWDDRIRAGELEESAAYRAARRRLLRRAKGKKERVMQAVPADAPQSAAAPQLPASSKARSKRSSPPGGEMDLAAQILARRSEREAGFDAWADGLAARAERRDAQRKAKRKSKRGDAVHAVAGPRRKGRSISKE